MAYVKDLARDAWRMFGRRWQQIVAVEIAFKALGALLTTLGSSALLAWAVARSGGAAVTNTDLVRFVALPGTLVLLYVGAGGVLAFILAEQAALLAIINPDAPPTRTAGERVRAVAGAIVRVAGLAGLC